MQCKALRHIVNWPLLVHSTASLNVGPLPVETKCKMHHPWALFQETTVTVLNYKFERYILLIEA